MWRRGVWGCGRGDDVEVEVAPDHQAGDGSADLLDTPRGGEERGKIKGGDDLGGSGMEGGPAGVEGGGADGIWHECVRCHPAPLTLALFSGVRYLPHGTTKPRRIGLVRCAVAVSD